MNAYELADELQKLDARLHLINLFKSADMLRQQADRIAELEKQSEPVAWMEYIQGEEWEVWYVEPTDLPEGHTYKPLYLAPQTKPTPEGLIDPKSYYIGYEDGKKAPQTKPLSDEEIKEIWEGLFENEDDIVHIHNFARAIEERHGIK